MTVHIIVDSSACLPSRLARQHDIAVVPIRLTVGGEEQTVDDVSRGELLERLDAGDEVHTSAPTPGQFLEAIEEHDDGDGVVVVTLASHVSATHRAASVAAGTSEREVRVVDSGTAAGGHGLIALAGARLAAGGADLDDVAKRCEDIADRTRLVAVVGSLEQLARSGRVPAAARRAGDAIGIRPLFEFRHGEPKVLIPSLSRDRSLERVLRKWRESRPGPDAVAHVTALHADAPDEAGWLLERVRGDAGEGDTFVSTFDASMIAHTGRDVVGLAWYWET